MTTTSAPPPSTTLSPLASTRFPCLHNVAAGLQRYRARWLPPLRLDAVHLRGAARDQVLAVRTRLPAVSIPGEPVTVVRGIWQFSNSEESCCCSACVRRSRRTLRRAPTAQRGRDTLLSETEVLGFHSPAGWYKVPGCRAATVPYAASRVIPRPWVPASLGTIRNCNPGFSASAGCMSAPGSNNVVLVSDLGHFSVSPTVGSRDQMTIAPWLWICFVTTPNQTSCTSPQPEEPHL